MSLKVDITEISQSTAVDMADEWYDIADLNHFWIEGRFNFLVKNKKIPELANRKLLEIGCGNGLLIRQFEKHFNIVVDGCDLNLKILRTIKNIKGRLFVLNIYDKPPDLINEYDGIILFDVLEHIDDDAGFLKTASQYLKKSGWVFINVPALKFLFSKYDRMAGHKRRYNKKTLQELIAKNNIEIISIYYWGLSMIPLVLLRKIMLPFIPDSKAINAGFKPSTGLLNRLLKFLLHSESRIFKSPFLGTSLMVIGKYKNDFND